MTTVNRYNTVIINVFYEDTTSRCLDMEKQIFTPFG